WSTVVRQPTL
ncbi:M42 glutamyl aminopeptidase family protein, partial [Vibrio parahaemolyticus V-223/04]